MSTVYREYLSLSDLPEHCVELMHSTGEQNLFLSRPWFVNLVAHGIEGNAKLLISSAENQAGTEALVMLLLRRPAGQNGSTLTDWQFSEDTAASLTNFQSSFFDLLINSKANSTDDGLTQLVDGLCSRQDRLALIDLNLMNPDSENYSRLIELMSKRSYLVKPYSYKGNWYESQRHQSFDEYVSSRDKSSRKAIRNYQRKWRKLESENRISIRRIKDSELSDSDIEACSDIHSKSWKNDDYFPEFYNGLVKRLSSSGGLRLIIIYMDGAPAAYEFAVVSGFQCAMMRTSYDTSFRNESVGSIAIMAMIEWICEIDGAKEFDFGTDDDRYKATWVSQRRERHGFICFDKKSVSGWALYLKYEIRIVYRRYREKIVSFIKKYVKQPKRV